MKKCIYLSAIVWMIATIFSCSEVQDSGATSIVDKALVDASSAKTKTTIYRDSVSGKIMCRYDTVANERSAKYSVAEYRRPVVLFYANGKQLKDHAEFIETFRNNGQYDNCKTWVQFVGNDTILNCMEVLENSKKQINE